MAENGVFDRDKITRIKTLLKFNPKGLTITEISQKLKLSRISVSKYLDILLISGQVEMKMYGVAKAFFLSSRVPISAMLSFSSDFILILDNNLQILQINDNFLKFLGVEKSNLLGNSTSHPSLSFLKGLPLHSLVESNIEQKELISEVSTTHESIPYYFRAKVIPTVFDDGSQGVTIILENITETKQSDKMKSFLAAIIDSSNEGIIGKDLTGKILTWNRAAEMIYGYSADEMMGQNIAILVPEEYKRDLPYLFEKIKRGETITHYETKRVKKNGEFIDVLLTISPIRDESGSVTAITTISQDVTDVNKLREELRIKREKLHEIIEFLPDPTFIVDRNKNILGWNKALEDFTGIKKPDMIGKYAINRIKSISGTYRPLLIDFLDKPMEDLPPIYSQVKRTKNDISAELYMPNKNIYIWIKASPLYDHDGRFIGGIETIKDISKWRNTEESLKKSKDLLAKEMEDKIKILIDENARLMEELYGYQEPLNTRILLERGLDVFNQKLMIIDYKGIIKYISDRMASHLGIANKIEVIGSNIFHMIDSNSSQSILQLLVSPNGKAINIDCSFSPAKDSLVMPITVALIKQNDNVSGFLIRDQENLVPSKEDDISLTERLVKSGYKSKQMICEILLLTPFLTILTDFFSF